MSLLFTLSHAHQPDRVIYRYRYTHPPDAIASSILIPLVLSAFPFLLSAFFLSSNVFFALPGSHVYLHAAIHLNTFVHSIPCLFFFSSPTSPPPPTAASPLALLVSPFASVRYIAASPFSPYRHYRARYTQPVRLRPRSVEERIPRGFYNPPAG